MKKGMKENKRTGICAGYCLAVLFAFAVILSVGVTDARAGNSYGYGVDNPASLEWSEDEYDELVNNVIDNSRTQTSEQSHKTYYYNLENILVKEVFVNPQTTGNVEIKYSDPSTRRVIARKIINSHPFSGQYWTGTYSLYDSDDSNNNNLLKRLEVKITPRETNQSGAYTITFENGTKEITETDYFVPNVKKNINNAELIQFVKTQKYTVTNGTEKLTESSVTENKAISKNGDKEAVKVYTATTTEGENGNRTVCYEYFENDGSMLAKKVIDTVEHRGDASTGYYVITGRTTEYYGNGALVYSTEEEFEIYGSDYVKTQITRKNSGGNVTSVIGVTAIPDCSNDYLGRKTYTANLVASPGAIASGKVVTRISTEDNSVTEEEYDNAGYLFRVTTRDDKCNILTTEERVGNPDTIVNGNSHICTDELKDPFGKVTRRITYTDNIDGRYYLNGHIDEELYYKSETKNNKKKQKTSTTMESNRMITARTTIWYNDDEQETTSREWIEVFDDNGQRTSIEKRSYSGDNYVSETYNAGNNLIKETSYKENYLSESYGQYIDELVETKYDNGNIKEKSTKISQYGGGGATLDRVTITYNDDGSVTTRDEDFINNLNYSDFYTETVEYNGHRVTVTKWSAEQLDNIGNATKYTISVEYYDVNDKLTKKVETVADKTVSNGIKEKYTETCKDANDNITCVTEKIVYTDGSECSTVWSYDENHERKGGVETLTAAGGATQTVRKLDADGNEIDKSISVTVTLSETSFTYTGSEIKPTVTVKGVNGENEISFTENTDYTVSYENNTEVGTAKAVVTDVFGGTYEVIGFAEFSITQASISPKVEMRGWTAGSSASEPVVTGNPGNGTVTVSYKEKDADDATYTDNKPATAGQYTVMVKIAETKNYKGGSATADFTVSAPATQPVDDPNQGTSSGTETTSGTETETTSGTTEGTDDKNTSGSGTTAGTEDKNTSGSGTTAGTDDKNSSGTGNGNTSGTTTGTENSGTSEKDKEEKDNSGSTTVREERTNEDGSTVIKEETKNKDGSSVVKEEIKNTDGSTVVKEETTAADGSTVVKEETTDENGNVSSTETATDADGTVTKREETKDATGAGSATEVVADAQGNVLSTTEETTTVSKKGTVTVVAVTKNSDDSTVEKTEKNYKADKEGNVKTVTNLTETAADGSVVKTKETTVVDAKGNTTAVSKKTVTNEEGKKEVTTTTAELDVKGKGVIVSETKVGKKTTASETYSLSSKGTAKVTKLETKETTVIVPETLEVAGKEVPVTTISKNAMKNNKKITDVTIGENITTVGAGAFKGSKNLANVSLTASITKISKNAFAGIAPNAVFKIKGTKEDFDRIVALLKKSGVADTVTFELEE